MAINVGMVANAFLAGRTEAQKADWLPRLAEGADSSFGDPIAQFQLIQAMLAESKAEIYAAECMLADRVDQIHGGAGYLKEYDAERFFRASRIYRIDEGTTQIQQLVIARNMIRDYEARH